jgi:hypothetical protein
MTNLDKPNSLGEKLGFFLSRIPIFSFPMIVLGWSWQMSSEP